MIITNEMVISGFVSKIINEIVDVPLNPIKDAIKNADKNRRDKNANIETRIYQVTIDAINEFTKNKYKEQDALYDAAESIIKGFKSNKNSNPEAVRVGLKILVSQVTSDKCEDFLGVLCYEICKEENRDLAIEVIILQQKQTNGYIQEGFRRSFLNDEEINQKLDFLIKELINKKVHEEQCNSEKTIENKAERYISKWDKNVFLNDFNKRDENAGVNIKLSELYLENQLPHYIWKTNEKPKYDLKDLLREYIVDKGEKKMLLILGQPGIGKSTLITWIMANLVEKNEEILIYQFASDLINVDWQSKNVLNDICSVIEVEYDGLENKTLILDGFDEIYTGSDRERILNKLNEELREWSTLKSFSLIITCRENYIYDLENIKCDYITLQVWEETQIDSFCRTYWEKCANDILDDKIQKIQENKEIFGIPLILYMILALNINIEKDSSVVDIYDQIFSVKKGGIYDRCYDTEHRINAPEIKKYIHQISQRISFWIFENNASEAFISKNKFEEICENVINELGEDGEKIQSDTLIGNFFRLRHCERKGTDELQFVHRSIYEYFVVIYFFESIHKLKSKEEVAGKLGELLKDGYLSKQILEFIKCKFDSMKEYSLFDITKEVFNIMLKDGMTYYTKEHFKNIFEREMNIFLNMLEVIHLWNPELGEFDDNIVRYLCCYNLKSPNLKGIKLENANLVFTSLAGADLSGANLSGADLSGANLISGNLNGADLRRANLSGSNLIGVKLKNANLSRANLNGANISEANLSEANLSEANLRELDLSGLDLSGANLSGADLSGANLSEANLRRANLSRTDLCGASLIIGPLAAVLRRASLLEANLEETIFNENQVSILYKKYDLSKSYVYLSKTHELISYQEYCVRKKVK